MSDLKNIIILLKFIAGSLLTRRKKSSNVKMVHSITFRDFSPEGGRGGGSAVQSCQNILLGSNYKNMLLKYTYKEDNVYSKALGSRLFDLWGGTLFAINKTKNDSDCVYITHDYGTGFGLALLKKNFVYVAHLQGPRVEEKINYNEFITSIDKTIIKFCERFVFKRALYVCFPSIGAKEHYFSSPHRSIDINKSNIGNPLYNTIYTDPENRIVNGIDKDNDFITIISIGALTDAKGIDRIPSFIKKLISNSNKKVRWIVVGNGYLKDAIKKQAYALQNEFENFKFFIKESCEYPQIRYLISISDVYLMMHRVSIFDLATLEAMKEGLCVALSYTGGNIDFNKDNNIVFIEDDFESAKKLAETNVSMSGMKNKTVYNDFFSNEKFIESYRHVIYDLCDYEKR